MVDLTEALSAAGIVCVEATPTPDRLGYIVINVFQSDSTFAGTV